MGHASVAPFTGAWIETHMIDNILCGAVVAPFTGAWIETRPDCERWHRTLVAPFTGAWIETAWAVAIVSASADTSHPSRVRGLKHLIYLIDTEHAHVVAPFTGAWIETLPRSSSGWRSRVAPFTGAWIETLDVMISL